MDRYVIGKINEFKVFNDASSKALIHEYYVYKYDDNEYVDIYVYLLDLISDVKINGKSALYTNVIRKDIVCLTYLSSDVMSNFLVTEYRLGEDVVNIKNDNLVNHEDYNFDKKNSACGPMYTSSLNWQYQLIEHIN